VFVNSVGGRGILTLYTMLYKNIKYRFFQVRAMEESVELDGFPNHWTSSPLNYGGYDLECLSTFDQRDVKDIKQLTLFTIMFKSSRIIEFEFSLVYFNFSIITLYV